MGAPVCGTHMLRIDICFWWIVPFISMKWPLLSPLIDFSLKSTLWDMSMATPACLWGLFAWKTFFYPLTLSQCLFCFFFFLQWVSCKQHMVGSCFLTQFTNLCLLIGALMPFIFSVKTEGFLLFPVIFTPPFLVLPIPCLLVCLLKRVYSFLSLSVSL
jgi:hypothetical protein